MVIRAPGRSVNFPAVRGGPLIVEQSAAVYHRLERTRKASANLSR
jgi:hypothetical protein